MPTTNPSCEEQLVAPGSTQNRHHALAYRAGLILQVLGAAVLAVLYPLQSPFYTIGIMLFEAGVLLSSLFLLVHAAVVKKIIVSAVLTGLALQVAGFNVQEQYAGTMLLAGIGLVSAGAAGMAGKEAYCFGYFEGWLLAVLFPFLAFFNLLNKEQPVVNAVGFSVLFLSLLFLAGRKLGQPLPSPCMTNTCGISEKKA